MRRKSRYGGPVQVLSFRRNVEALERVRNLRTCRRRPSSRAWARVWIPAGDVEGFIHEVLELKDCQVAYSAEAGAWSVTYPEWSARHNVKLIPGMGAPRA